MIVGKTRADEAGSAKSSPASAPPSTADTLGQGYLVTVENLLIHKFDEMAALLRKADKVCKEIINNELRDGEFVQVVRPGRYQFYFPKLRGDAGQLRCSVIAGQLYRAVRDLNPTAQRLNDPENAPLAPSSDKSAAKAGRVTASAPVLGVTASERAGQDEMRKQASQALAAMAGSGSSLAEELIGSSVGRTVQRELEIAQVPVWNVKTRLIIGYDCTPFRHGAQLLDTDPLFRGAGVEPRDARALIDIVVYERVCQLLREKLTEGLAGLIICPVHASTLENAKYVGAFIGTGAMLPEGARHSLVIVVKGFAIPTSRLKVQEVAGYLRSRCRSLHAEIPLEIDKISPAFKEFGFQGMRVDIANASSSETRLLKNFNTFIEKCEAARLDCGIVGLQNQSLTIGALAAGFSYLAGSAIAGPSSGQRGIVREFDIDQLFS